MSLQGDNEYIQRLRAAEDEAAQIVQAARDNRGVRLRQAEAEAEKAAKELREKLERELNEDVDLKDDSFDEYAKKLDAETEQNCKLIQQQYSKNKNSVMSLLLHHVTTIHLEVTEAMRQAVLTKEKDAQQGL